MKASPFFTIALNVSLLTSLLAQTPPQQPSRPSTPGEDEVVRVTTNLVQIDAVVTDKNGKPVTDLRPEDFEILEDNKPQPITAFSYVSTDSNSVASANPPAMPIKNAPPLPPIPLRPEQVRRTIVFVVDDLGLSLSSFNAVQSGLKKYVAEQMQPGDLVAVVRTGGGAGALQQLTADKHQLRESIDHLRWSCRNRVGTSPLGVLDPVSALKAGQCAPVPDLKDTVKALIYVVEGLKALPGRKSMLFFTDSFDVLKDNELVNRSGLTKPTPDINRLDEQIEQMMQGGGGEGVGSYSGDAKGLVRRLIDESNTASTVIYSVDARGLLVAGPTAQDSDESIFSVKNRTNLLDQRREDVWETQTGLAYLAHATSGFTILNNNDLGRGMERIMNDLKGYYLIGYRPSDLTFTRQNGTVPYHHLTVRMLRPGLNVRSRKGFYGTTASVVTNGAPRTKEQRMAEAVDSPFAAGGVHLRLTTLFGNVQQGSFVRTLLHIDARDLTFKEMPEGWHQADIDVMASSYGENGLIADYLSRSETIRARGKTYANLLRYGLNYNLLVPIKKPGPYQLRAAVRDAPTDRIGSAYQFIEVPDLKKGRLALSGIALSSAVLDLAALSSASGVYNAPSDNGEEAQPTPAVRRFKPGMLLDYRYVIYNALPGPKNSLPELTAQVRLFRGGELVTSSDQPARDTSRLQFDPKRLSAKGSLRLGDDLMPGNYVLQILVTDPRAKGQASTASQWIDFEIVK
jgi:VWFA-related protein